jgi:serine/threonine protein kinase
VEPAPERRIGRYRVTSVLGRGAMGEVLRAHDERLGRDVAIKRVKNVFGGLAAAGFQARFDAEARALAALAHPGVVQVFDLGVDGDEPYLVMELIEGPTLRDVLTDGGPLPARDVCALGIQLARALEAAHTRGIVHRDVKPANVLRTPGGAWKLADFGVAHMPDSEATVSGQFLGTPAYAAPEALTQGVFSPASDVYGLGATLYEAATGSRPRGDATMAELIKLADEPVLDPRALPPSLGVLGPPLAAALAIDARARPSAAAFAEMLAGLGSTELPQTAVTHAPAMRAAASVTAMHATGEPGWRRWMPTIVGAVLIVGVLAFIARMASSGDDRPSPAAGPGWSAPPNEPTSFAPPPDLDGRAAKDWRKVADKVHEGKYREAVEKLREFERKHGASAESARLRTWLERQPRGNAGHDYD